MASYEDCDSCEGARDEISNLKERLVRLQDAAAPFLTAAKVIAAHDTDYAPRIVMLGGLADACDLTKDHFARLLQVAQPLS